MTLHRSPNTPHLFYPETAKKYGVNVAIVQAAGWELNKGQCPTTGEEIEVSFQIDDVIKRCSYLSEEEVRDSIEVLREIGSWGVVQ